MEFLAILEMVVNVITLVEVAIKVLAPVIQGIGQALGLIDETENSEDLGGRALNAEADGVVPENFASFEEYLEEVKKYSPECDKSLEDRLKKGSELILGLIAEMYPELDTGVFEVIAGTPELFSGDWGKHFGELIKNGDLDSGDVSDFLLSHSMSEAKRIAVAEKLVSIEQKMNPNVSYGDALVKVYEMQKK